MNNPNEQPLPKDVSFPDVVVCKPEVNQRPTTLHLFQLHMQELEVDDTPTFALFAVIQGLQQEMLREAGLIPAPSPEWTQELAGKLVMEAVEVQQAVARKTHRVVKVDPDGRSKLLDECVDVLKFSLALLMDNGFTVDEIGAAFHRKTLTVKHRADEKCQELKGQS